MFKNLGFASMELITRDIEVFLLDYQYRSVLINLQVSHFMCYRYLSQFDKDMLVAQCRVIMEV